MIVKPVLDNDGYYIINSPKDLDFLKTGDKFKYICRCKTHVGENRQVFNNSFRVALKHVYLLMFCKTCSRLFSNRNNHGGMLYTQTEEYKNIYRKYRKDHPELVTKIIESNKRNHGGVLHTQTKQFRDMMNKHKVKIFNKMRKTCMERYGVDNYTKTDEYIAKAKETNNKKYNSDWYTQSNEYKKNGTKIKEKIKETCTKKYGVDNVLKSEEIKQKTKNTCNEKYGVDNYAKSKEFKNRKEEIRNKVKKTNVDRYGKDNYTKTEMYREYRRNNPELFGRQVYLFDRKQFDSSTELYYYIYMVDHGHNISRCNISYTYKINESDKDDHVYYPDFIVDGKVVEIKGDHYIDKEGNLINPFKHKKISKKQMNELYKAKGLCMKLNKVELITHNSDIIKKCKKYVHDTYGKDFINQFKLENLRLKQDDDMIFITKKFS